MDDGPTSRMRLQATEVFDLPLLGLRPRGREMTRGKRGRVSVATRKLEANPNSSRSSQAKLEARPRVAHAGVSYIPPTEAWLKGVLLFEPNVRNKASALIFSNCGPGGIEDGAGNPATRAPALSTLLYAFTGRVWDPDAELYYYLPSPPVRSDRPCH